jgi:predicted RNA methylase
MNFHPLQAVRSLVTQAEGWWFDRTRHVKTSGYIPLEQLTLMGEGKAGFEYFPTRPSVARDVLNRLPVQSCSEYTFVDLGSGMGRVLFLAAEHPFRKVQGVEFAVELHQKARENIARYRYAQRKCAEIESINADVSGYAFPPGNLVIFLFNPFGAELTQRIFAHLGTSLAADPRHVVVAMVNPEFAGVADATPFLRLCSETPRYRIYQNDPH